MYLVLLFFLLILIFYYINRDRLEYFEDEIETTDVSIPMPNDVLTKFRTFETAKTVLDKQQKKLDKAIAEDTLNNLMRSLNTRGLEDLIRLLPQETINKIIAGNINTQILLSKENIVNAFNDVNLNLDSSITQKLEELKDNPDFKKLLKVDDLSIDKPFNTYIDGKVNETVINTQNDNTVLMNINHKKKTSPNAFDLSVNKGVLLRTYNKTNTLVTQAILSQINFYSLNSNLINDMSISFLEMFGVIKIDSGVSLVEFELDTSIECKFFFGVELLIDEFYAEKPNNNNKTRILYVEPNSYITYKIITRNVSDPQLFNEQFYCILKWRLNNNGPFNVVSRDNFYLPNLTSD
jgi:hypothetical protein